jgi:transcriptional regulator with XRE-family HTH domain
MSKELKTILPDLGRRLRQERDRLSLTQDQVSSAIGVSKGTYYTYEKDLYAPSVDSLSKLSELGMDLYFILFGTPIESVYAPALPLDVFHRARQSIKEHVVRQGGKIDAESLDVLLMGVALAHTPSSPSSNTDVTRKTHLHRRARK